MQWQKQAFSALLHWMIAAAIAFAAAIIVVSLHHLIDKPHLASLEKRIVECER